MYKTDTRYSNHLSQQREDGGHANVSSSHHRDLVVRLVIAAGHGQEQLVKSVPDVTLGLWGRLGLFPLH